MSTIYVVGDSHTQVFQGNKGINGPHYGDNDSGLGIHKERFKVCHIGPYIAYNIYNKISVVDKAIENINKDRDYLFFSFGEIDCRHHIGFHKDDKNKSLEEAVYECVSRYVKFLKHYKNENYKVGVWGPPPTGAYENLAIAGLERPLYKSMFERNQMTALFNFYLLTECKQHGIIYKGIYDQTCHNFVTDTTYFMDGVHFSCIKTGSLILKEFWDISPE